MIGHALCLICCTSLTRTMVFERMVDELAVPKLHSQLDASPLCRAQRSALACLDTDAFIPSTPRDTGHHEASFQHVCRRAWAQDIAPFTTAVTTDGGCDPRESGTGFQQKPTQRPQRERDIQSLQAKGKTSCGTAASSSRRRGHSKNGPGSVLRPGAISLWPTTAASG